MFELSDFYTYCDDNDIDVIPYMGMPSEGATVRDQGYYAIFLDIAKIRSTRLLKGVCCHEMGHAATGALHKVCSPYETVERSEYRANRWVAENHITDKMFRDAFRDGYTEIWQLAEYFDLPEDVVRTSAAYWMDSKGVDFNTEEI